MLQRSVKYMFTSKIDGSLETVYIRVSFVKHIFHFLKKYQTLLYKYDSAIVYLQ